MHFSGLFVEIYRNNDGLGAELLLPCRRRLLCLLSPVAPLDRGLSAVPPAPLQI